MFKARRFFCALLALALLAGMVSVAAAVPETAPSATVYTHDGRVTLIDGATVDTPVMDFDGASRVVDGVLDQLGGGFLQISRSCAVSLSRAESVEAGFGGSLLLKLKNGLSDYVSRRYLPGLRNCLGI